MVASSLRRKPLGFAAAVVRRFCAPVAICSCLAFAAPLCGQGTETVPGLPELVQTKHRTFTIPYRVPKSQDPDADAAAQRIVLNVSKDLGATWQSAGEAAPAKGSFTFTAEADGEYWFRLRAIDRKGRSRGGEGPDMRVLVDAAGPRLAARVWKGNDGEIVCRYAAVDGSLRLDSFKFEYRGPGDQGWKSLAAQPILSREAPAHVVGEEIWWAGEKVETMAVRIAISDASGNQTVRQFSLEPSDPAVDQAALARELGVPPLPEAGGANVAAADSVLGAAQPPRAGEAAFGAAPGAWAAEAGAAWSGGQPQVPGGAEAGAGRGRSVLVKRAAASDAAALMPRTDEPSRGSAGAQDSWSAVAEGMRAVSGQALEYKGKPLHMARARRFSWDYESDPAKPGVGALRAELWTTRDGGVTWQRTAVDRDGLSPIDVQLPAAGFYGVRLEMVAEVPDAGAGPRSGDAPEAWLGVDDEPPHVDLLGVTRDESTAAGGLVIRYAARDPLLVPRGARLLYSPNAEGPWATIAEGLDSQGEYRWQPDRSVPARVHVRIEVIDAAGNVGKASTAEAITVATPRFVGKLGGLRPAAP
jgi:hypothetical protein